MEKSKLLPLITKIGKGNSKIKRPVEFYTKLTKEDIYTPIFNKLDALDIVLICFLSPLSDSVEDLGQLYDNVLSGLFTFSLIEVSEKNPTVSCPECGGTGFVDCGECDGHGEVYCPDCGGNGEDSDSNKCVRCSSWGKIGCDICSETGSVRCDNCDIMGGVVDYENSDVLVYTFVSWDVDLMNSLEVMEEQNYQEKVSMDFYNRIMYSEKTFILNIEEASVDFLSSTSENDDIFFISFNKEISLVKSINNKEIIDFNLPTF